jgi:hypothetical protein
MHTGSVPRVMSVHSVAVFILGSCASCSMLAKAAKALLSLVGCLL